MKAVMISIQPKWWELIANGKKTVEVRKTKPKIDVPFKCYIYETQGRTETPFVDEEGHEIFKGRGQVMGEFVCKRIDRIGKRGGNNNFDYCYLPLVWGNDDIEVEITDIRKSCISINDLNSYGASSTCLYAWHITDLVIYDKPKELIEFNYLPYRDCDIECSKCKYGVAVDTILGTEYDCNRSITRPPQSWCYCEELK